MNYNFETVGAQIVADYLDDEIDPLISNICPVVTFFDPMSIQEDHRFVVMVPRGQTDPAQPGNAEMMIDVTVKSRWTPKTLKADFDAHFARVNAAREALFVEGIADGLRQFAPADMGVNAVKNRSEFSTNVYKENWIVSDTTIRVELFARAVETTNQTEQL